MKKPITTIGSATGLALQPVAKVQLHSTCDASRLAAWLLPQIFPICSVVAPCQPGASPVSVRRWTFTTGCLLIIAIAAGVAQAQRGATPPRAPAAQTTSAYR
jgi:hypothetical protein